MPKRKTRTTYTAVAKRRLRQMLHADLDRMLNGETVEDGVTMTTLDSMVGRALEGFGFNVRVHALHPSQTERREAPATVEPGPQVGLVRGP